MAPTARCADLGKHSMHAALSILFLREVACVPSSSGGSPLESDGDGDGRVPNAGGLGAACAATRRLRARRAQQPHNVKERLQ